MEWVHPRCLEAIWELNMALERRGKGIYLLDLERNVECRRGWWAHMGVGVGVPLPSTPISAQPGLEEQGPESSGEVRAEKKKRSYPLGKHLIGWALPSSSGEPEWELISGLGACSGVGGESWLDRLDQTLTSGSAEASVVFLFGPSLLTGCLTPPHHDSDGQLVAQFFPLKLETEEVYYEIHKVNSVLPFGLGELWRRDTGG